jgi:hypothetical protein
MNSQYAPVWNEIFLLLHYGQIACDNVVQVSWSFQLEEISPLLLPSYLGVFYGSRTRRHILQLVGLLVDGRLSDFSSARAEPYT